MKKPDSRFFEMLLKKHEIAVDKSIMIGNDAKSDIGGAKSVGLDTFYIHSNISPELPTVETIDENGKKVEKSVLPDADIVLPEMDMKQILAILQEN